MLCQLKVLLLWNRFNIGGHFIPSTPNHTRVRVRSRLQRSLFGGIRISGRGIVETARSVTAVRVNSRSQELDPQVETQLRYKPEENPAKLAAKSSSLGRAYMHRARFPIT